MRRILLLLLLASVLITAILMFAHAGRQTDVRAWQQYEAELARHGETLVWQTFVPPPIPDAENFLEAPGMMAWFSRQRSSSNRTAIFRIPGSPLTLASVKALPELGGDALAGTAAWDSSRQDLRNWFTTLQPSYQLLVNASARPSMRFNADFTAPPEELDVPSFVNLRKVAQALSTHANLSWVDQRPDLAMQDLHLLQRVSNVSASTPTLVGGMIRVAVYGLYADTVADALRAGVLRDGDLMAIQHELKDVDLVEVFTRSLRAERAAEAQLLKRSPKQIAKVLATSPSPGRSGFRYTPAAWKDWFDDLRLRLRLRSRSWIYRNLTVVARAHQEALDHIDLPQKRLHSQALAQSFARLVQGLSTSSDTRLAGMLVPNCTRAALVTAQRQTLLDELQVGCALERYRRQRGSYPEQLQSLIPEFLEAVPKDLFADGPLQYRRSPEGRYQLWSIGWDEQDDHGLPGPPSPDGSRQFLESKADWVFSPPLDSGNSLPSATK